MSKKGWLLAVLIIGVTFQTACSSQSGSAEANKPLEVAGVDWVEQEVGKLDSQVDRLEGSTRQLDQDIKEIEAALNGTEIEPIFIDVKKDYWAYNEIMYMYNNGYITGYPKEKRFKPENYLTRAQAAAMLVNVLGLPLSNSSSPFRDIKGDFWAKQEIVTVAEYGLFNGSDGNFMPNSPMTRKHMAVVLQRAFNLQPTSAPFTDYVDVPKDDDGYNYIKIITQNGIANGSQETGEFMPYQPTKRSQFSAFLYRAIEKGFVN